MTDDDPAQPLFKTALGPQFDALPVAVRDLHNWVTPREFRGEARITTTKNPIAWGLRTLFGFPNAHDGLPVTVRMHRDGAREVWQRAFGRHRFNSTLSLARHAGSGHIFERFGAFCFEIALTLEGDGLYYPVHRAWLGPLPLPASLRPQSTTVERDVDGRFHFDVEISLPLVGLICRYQGWLTQCDPSQ